MKITVKFIDNDDFLKAIVTEFGQPNDTNAISDDILKFHWNNGSMELAETLVLEMFMRNNILDLHIEKP